MTQPLVWSSEIVLPGHLKLYPIHLVKLFFLRFNYKVLGRLGHSLIVSPRNALLLNPPEISFICNSTIAPQRTLKITSIPKKSTDMGKFVISTRKNGEFQFNLKADNGQIILTSEGYTTKAACENGIVSVRKNSADDTRYERRIMGRS